MASELFPIELKTLGDDGVIEGYASVFGNRDLDGDIVQPFAFARSLKTRPAREIAMLWAHDSKRPIGVWDEVTEDTYGLKVKGRILKNTRDGADAFEFAKAGAARGLSIGYRTVKSRRSAEQKARLLDDVELFEISLLPLQANGLARVENVKSPHCPDRARRLVAQLNAAAAALRAGEA